jgi:hypothetical protein
MQARRSSPVDREERLGVNEQRPDLLLGKAFKGQVDLVFGARFTDNELLSKRISRYLRLFGVGLGIRVLSIDEEADDGCFGQEIMIDFDLVAARGRKGES